MLKHLPPTEGEHPSGALSRWELQHRHRQLLNQRIRLVRRSLLVGGVVGTVAFSALSGYETEVASSAGTDPTPAESSVTGTPATDFFANQESTGLGAAPPTATAATGLTQNITSPASPPGNLPPPGGGPSGPPTSGPPPPTPRTHTSS
jgi:hypothetical protein